MFEKICSSLGFTRTNLTAMAEMLRKAANKNISAPIRDLLLDASTLLGSVTQAMLLEKAGEDEPFVLQQLRNGREDIRQLAIALECAVCYSSQSTELNHVLGTSAHALFHVQQALCRTCGGHGQIGGWSGSAASLDGGGAHEIQACPECQSDAYGASQRSSAVALMQTTSVLSAAIALAAKCGADAAQLKTLVARQTELLDAFSSGPSQSMLPVRSVRPAGAIMVGRAELAMVTNTMQRDAASGLEIRGEILEELNRSIEKYEAM